MSNFDECLKLVLHHEGGYVNHPKDPGGETNMGVTKRVYEKLVKKSLDKNLATKSDMTQNSLTKI